MITHVAIKDSNGKIWALEKPNRHHDIIRWIYDVNSKEYAKNLLSSHEQGFTNYVGEFFNRTDAYRHAVDCQQINKELFSEDLW